MIPRVLNIVEGVEVLNPASQSSQVENRLDPQHIINRFILSSIGFGKKDIVGCFMTFKKHIMLSQKTPTQKTTATKTIYSSPLMKAKMAQIPFLGSIS